MAAKKADLYIAVDSASTIVDGDEIWIKKGDLVSGGSSILKGRDWLFRPVENDEHIRFKDEKATAAPGEERGE